MSFYGEDLAFAHAHGWNRLGVIAAERLIQEMGRSTAKSGVVVELGCGPGVAAARLLSERLSVVGIDISPDMVSLAKANAPRGTFHRASWVDFEIPPCDAVLAAGEVLNYTSEGVTLRHLERLFSRVHRALWPGGLFVFDLAGPGRVVAGTETRTTVGEDWAVIAETTEDRRGTLQREITVLRKVGGRLRTSTESHRQRLIPTAKALAMLRKTGFRVRNFQGYDGERAAPGHTVFIARRP